MPDPVSFGSDNHSGIHPLVLDAIQEANAGHTIAYGKDPWTEKLENQIRELFGDDARIFPVFNGTGANVLAIKAMTRPYHSVICTAQAHIHNDECGAPEHFSGCKLKPVETTDGRLCPEDIERALQGRGDEHHSQPKVVSITQSTELGTTYSPEQLRAICETAHRHDLFVHMDGARIANAAAFLGVPFRSITTDVGIDIISFGGTKNGLLQGESILVLNPGLMDEMKFIRKQGMQLASKMRFLSAQFLAYLRDDLWQTNAEHANRMARLLADRVSNVPGVEITQPVEANGVFARLPKAVIPRLQEDYFFYVWDEDQGIARWMASFDTPERQVLDFASAVSRLCRGAD